MAAWMGYGRSFQDFKINIHISGRQGPAGLRAAWNRLSPEAKNCITVENEEMTHGLDLCLDVSDIVPVVLDIHHHWVREGEYILPNDVRVKRVIDSWRGIRPVLHYSLTSEEYVTDHVQDVRPCRNTLMEAGVNKQKLRTHSDWYWNRASNDWALSFWPQFDIMCESKAKNLASFALYEQAQNRA
jgi:UV DNA damage repair endonuclease